MNSNLLSLSRISSNFSIPTKAFGFICKIWLLLRLIQTRFGKLTKEPDSIDVNLLLLRSTILKLYKPIFENTELDNLQ